MGERAGTTVAGRGACVPPRPAGPEANQGQLLAPLPQRLPQQLPQQAPAPLGQPHAQQGQSQQQGPVVRSMVTMAVSEVWRRCGGALGDA